MPKARIISDGTGAGTRAFLADGTEIKNIKKISLEMGPRASIAHIEVILINPEIDVISYAAIRNVDV